MTGCLCGTGAAVPMESYGTTVGCCFSCLPEDATVVLYLKMKIWEFRNSMRWGAVMIRACCIEEHKAAENRSKMAWTIMRTSAS